jgi:hypothetical protein
MPALQPIPFGLLFEEKPIENWEDIPYFYDEDEDLSVVLSNDGRKIPFVESCGIGGTKTMTKIKDEGSDDDVDAFQGTRTVTEKQSESSDSDDENFVLLGTKTATSVQSEQSDSDSDISYGPKPPLTTRTLTHTQTEESDSDN